MDKIDAEHWSPQSGYSARGSCPTPHHHQDRELTSPKGANSIYLSCCEAVPGLLLPFYNEQWLEECSNDYIQ